MVGELAPVGEGGTLAKGVSKADFAGAIKAMRGVVGDEWVAGDAESVKPWTKTYIPDPGGRHRPVGAVCPAMVEDPSRMPVPATADKAITIFTRFMQSQDRPVEAETATAAE